MNFHKKFTIEINPCQDVFEKKSKNVLKHFLERDFFGRFPGIAEICETKREEIYTPSKEQRKEDAESIQRIFHKPYPETYKENLAILQHWLEFLQKNNIKTVFLFMPFPTQFCELTNGEMKRQTYLALEKLCRKYGADLIDLYGDQTAFTDADFFDWSHLNAAGAAKVTRYLNEYLMRETKREVFRPGFTCLAVLWKSLSSRRFHLRGSHTL